MSAPGGYQRPANPAPVSGPGALSQRTDGGPKQGVVQLPDAKYGENRDFVAQQQGAPLSKSPNQPTEPVSSSPMQGGSNPPPDAAAQTPLDLVHMGAPTGRPNEPVTAGAALGPGPGPAPAAEPAPMSITAAMQPYVGNDHTGQLASLMWSLNEMGL
jgi:hypothetical protein